MSALEFRSHEVNDEKDLEALRQIRNECASFMTGSQDLIERDTQLHWWASIPRADWRVFLYTPSSTAKPVAYGLLRRRAGRWWATGGVTEAWRGRGLGRRLFRHLCDTCPSDETWLQLWDWNERALYLYQSLGFETVERDRHLLTMRRDRHAEPSR